MLSGLPREKLAEFFTSPERGRVRLAPLAHRQERQGALAVEQRGLIERRLHHDGVDDAPGGTAGQQLVRSGSRR